MAIVPNMDLPDNLRLVPSNDLPDSIEPINGNGFVPDSDLPDEPVTEPTVEAEGDLFGKRFNDFWSDDNKGELLAKGIFDNIQEQSKDPLGYTADVGRNFLGGAVKGFGDIVTLPGVASRWINDETVETQPKSFIEQGGDKLKELGLSIGSKPNESAMFASGEVLGLPGSIGLKTSAKLAENAVKSTYDITRAAVNPALDIIDKAVSPTTGRIIDGIGSVKKPNALDKLILKRANEGDNYVSELLRDGISGSLKSENKRGTIRDKLKSNFVQDYRLKPGYVQALDQAESDVRGVDKIVEQSMKDIKANLTDVEQDDMLKFLDGKIFKSDLEAKYPKVKDTNSPFGSGLRDSDFMIKANKAEKLILKKTRDLEDLKMIPKGSYDLLDGNIKDGRGPGYLRRVFDEENADLSKLDQIEGINYYRDPNKERRGLFASYGDEGEKFVNTKGPLDVAGSEANTKFSDKLFSNGFRQTGRIDKDGKQIWNRSFTDKDYEAFGSREDFASRYGSTAETQGQLQAKGSFFNKILEDKSIPTKNEPTYGMVRLDGSKYGNLDGKYVEPEVKQSIDMFTGNGDSFIPDSYRKFVNEWKANLVIKNPKSHANNIMGNITSSWYGDVPISEGLKGAKHAMSASTDALAKGSKSNYVQNMPNYEEAAKVGLFGRTRLDEMINQVTGIESSFAKNDLKIGTKKNNIDFSGARNTDKINKDSIGSNIYLGKNSSTGSRAYEMYKVEDDAFKLSNYNYWRSKGLSPEEARIKTEIAVFDYAKQMPKGVNALRDSGAVPFVSWTYKSIPLMAQTMAKNPSKIAATTAALYGVNEMFNGNEDNEIGSGKVRVGDRDVNVNQWTPYQEYLKPQKFGANLLFGGLPQNIAGLFVGKNMSFGSPRNIAGKNSTNLDTSAKVAEKLLMDAPFPGIYKAGIRSVKDEVTDKYDRNFGMSLIDRLFISNKPEKTGSRNRKRPTRKREKRD